MRVMHLSTYDAKGGAARVAVRLHEASLSAGMDSSLLVMCRTLEDRGVIGSKSILKKVLPRLDGLPTRVYNNRSDLLFSPAYVSDRVQPTIDVVSPDILHLHWVEDGFISIEGLAKLRKPLVWTLHDSWAFTGGCHIPMQCKGYEAQCGNCPTLGSQNPQDLSNATWKRKARAWEDLSLTIVTPSNWLKSCAAKSSLFCSQDIRVVPNGIDTTLFRPVPKDEARAKLGLDPNKFLVLFGARNGQTDSNKGYSYLKAAIERLPAVLGHTNIGLVVFGGNDKGGLPPDITVNLIGNVNDDKMLTNIYSAVDIFIAPSLSENFPNTILEAMACGTPCLAFAVGGIPDLIDHKLNGYLAEPYEIEDLVLGVHWLNTELEKSPRLSVNAVNKITSQFSIEKIVERYLNIYLEKLDSVVPPRL